MKAFWTECSLPAPMPSTRRISESSGRGVMRPLIVIVLICDLQVWCGWIFSAKLFWQGFLRGGLCLTLLRQWNDGAGDQRPRHGREIAEKGVGGLHPGVQRFGAVDRHFDAAGKLRGCHAVGESE